MRVKVELLKRPQKLTNEELVEEFEEKACWLHAPQWHSSYDKVAAERAYVCKEEILKRLNQGKVV